MTALRHHLLTHRAFAAWLIVLALAMKLLVPTGFMIVGAGDAIALAPCSGFGPQAIPGMAHAGMAASGDAHGASARLADPHHAMTAHDMAGDTAHGEKRNDGAGHGKAEIPCAFAGLSAPSLAAVDPLLLTVAIAFIVVTAFRLATRPRRVRAAAYLRPPLRGPPLRV